MSLSLITGADAFDRSLPINLRNQLVLDLRKSWSSPTIRNYDLALTRFFTFLRLSGLSIHSAFPVSDALLAAFVGHETKSRSYSAVKTSLAALRAYHVLRIAPWSAGILTSTALTASRKIPITTRPSRPQRVDVSIEMMNTLCRALSNSSSFDIAVRAAALSAFWGQCRLGEILSSSRVIFNASKLPSRHHITSPANEFAPIQLRLPWTKTTFALGASITLSRQSSAVCPVLAIQKLLSENLPPSISLFSYLADDGAGYNLTKNAFLSRCNEIWRQEHNLAVTGHSFRIGGTTHMLLEGIDPKVVQKAGRWNTDHFLVYWRKENQIINNHLAFLS